MNDPFHLASRVLTLCNNHTSQGHTRCRLSILIPDRLSLCTTFWRRPLRSARWPQQSRPSVAVCSYWPFESVRTPVVQGYLPVPSECPLRVRSTFGPQGSALGQHFLF